MDGWRGRGRGRGLGSGRARGLVGRGVREGGGRWPHRPQFNHPPPEPQPPPPVTEAGDVDDECGSNKSGFPNNRGFTDAMMPQSSSSLSSSPSPVSGKSYSDDNPCFDICRSNPNPKNSPAVVLKPSLLQTNRERRRSQTQSHSLLRPGMVLLKAHISLSDQVKIVKACRDLGVGPGGFYQPGYEEGTQLHLKMMCLGKHWDPHSSQYGDTRPFDGAKPPDIPPEFHQLVHSAIACSHALMQQEQPQSSHPHKILPSMSPDICIVNFYSQNGRLGLHQDKDESQHSLRQGLPVVSFSIGDSADFLYGNERDVEKAQKVVLDSGDVLIFGGSSRHVFHGVTAIRQSTAPSPLLQQSNLRPGRLNLTFRQY